ncbi:MAG: hypothetical protein PHE24_06155 [Patescibacteria group bacterium]|nr:hypothetical protein [Patescibacteria group bacterium]
MDKKTKTIVIVVIAVVVLGGLIYGYNRWRQQQLANQILKSMYGVDAGLLGGLTGGKVSEQVAKQIAQQAAQDALQEKNDAAKEAAKTPQDKYNATEEMPTYDANSKAAVEEAKSIIEKAFGKTKLTSFYSNNYGADNFIASSMEFTIARLTTGADLGELNKALTDKGLPIIQSGISDKTATIMAGSDETATYSFGFEIGGQTVSASTMNTSQ